MSVGEPVDCPTRCRHGDNIRLSEKLTQGSLLFQTGCKIASGFHYLEETDIIFTFFFNY